MKSLDGELLFEGGEAGWRFPEQRRLRVDDGEPGAPCVGERWTQRVQSVGVRVDGDASLYLAESAVAELQIDGAPFSARYLAARVVECGATASDCGGTITSAYVGRRATP